MRFRSIYIVDLNQFIEAINKDVLLFSLEYDITNVNDLTNLFISRIILKMIEVQKNISNLFVFYYAYATVQILAGFQDFLKVIGKR